MKKIRITTTARISLYFCTAPVVLLGSALSGIGFVSSNAAALVTGTVVWAIWFVLLFLVAVPRTDVRLKRYSLQLRRAALAVVIVLVAIAAGQAFFVPALKLGIVDTKILGGRSEEILASFEDSFAYNDATVLTHQAVNNLLAGENPYLEPNIVKATVEFKGSHEKVTPLRLGRFSDVFPYPSPSDLELLWAVAVENPETIPVELESELNYPAGSFLLPALFSLLGIKDLRVIYAIFIALAVAWVAWILPGRRLLFLGACAVALEISNAVACGETGGLVFALLLAAWVLLPERLWVSTILLGIAVATKQTAWFYLPYFVIYVYAMVSRRKVIPVVAIVGAIFVVMNLPFFIGDPELWIRSIFAPMTHPMFPVGVGIITVVTGGIIPVQSSLPFTIIELAVMAGSIIWYAKNCRRFPNTAPILAVLPLFFAWRSLWPYFYYANIIMFAGVLANEFGDDRSPVTGPPQDCSSI